MITSKLVALEKQIAKALPGFVVKKTVMIMPPVERLVRGINFDRSAYDEISFSVTAFVMPLCVPTEYFGFTFGDRIRRKGGGDRWGFDMADLSRELVEALTRNALPFLSKAKNLDGFIDIANAAPKTGRTLEGLGYALAWSGKVRQAVEVFDQIIPMLNVNIAWQRELADQVRALSTKLIADPEGAQKQLAKWEEETVHNLGLEQFRGAS